jgi:hypothetical protein
MAIVYKILGEVKLMHEYYLTGSEGQTIFDQALQDDRISFLQQQFINDNRSVNQDIEFVVPEMLQDMFKNYHLRIVPSYFGFKLAVRCVRKKLPDNTTVFEPFIPLPADLSIFILLRAKNNINSFSSVPIEKPLQSAYFFTNDNFPGPRAFPFLASAVPAFDAARTYEQGELASFGISGIKVFLNNGAADPWLTLNGTGYVNEADRMLVPLRFNYNFPAGSNITDVSFTLEDSASNEVKKITAIADEPIKSVSLDFHTEQNTVKTIPSGAVAADSFYTLTISANGYFRTFMLLFADDALNISQYTGAICLKPTVPVAAFNLVDSAGLLHTRINPDTTKVPVPVFELWMKSRLVYWHYRNNERKNIKLMIDTQDVLAYDNGILITKDPHPLSYQPILLKKPDATFQYLPNPMPGEPVNVVNSKQFINILVPASKLFPLE